MINKFNSILKTDCDAVIITSPENRRYFTGFNSSAGYLIITKKEAVFFTDSRYIEAATSKITTCKSLLLKRIDDTIVPYLKELNIKNIYLETERLTVAELYSLKKSFGFCNVEAKEEVDEVINNLRATAADFQNQAPRDIHRVDDPTVYKRRFFFFGENADAQIAGCLDFIQERTLVLCFSNRRRTNCDNLFYLAGIAKAFEHFQGLNRFRDSLGFQKAVSFHVLTKTDAFL